VSGETVSAPEFQESEDIALTYSDLNDGQTLFTSSSTNANLNLDGFFTENQTQFYLRLRDTQAGEEQIGLVVATRIAESP